MKTTLKLMNEIAKECVTLAHIVEPHTEQATHIRSQDSFYGAEEKKILPEFGDGGLCTYNDSNDGGEYIHVELDAGISVKSVGEKPAEITIPVNATNKWLSKQLQKLKQYQSVLINHFK
jgi:hypothetical protein